MLIDGKFVDSLRSSFGELPAADLVARFIKYEFPGSIAVSSSFGTESAVLLKLVAMTDRNTPVLFLNTGVLFDETLAYVNELREHLDLRDVRFLEPEARIVEEEDPDTDLWISDADRCCYIRKVRPFRAALSGFDCWISGLKRGHGGTRQDIETIEFEDGRVKLNPLAHWSAQDIDAAFVAWQLPRHPLSPRGFRSIGCIPCTRVTQPGEDPRSGRWARKGKLECGIHSLLYARTQSGDTAQANSMHHQYLRRSWFITGVCGTVGRELLNQVLQYEPQQVVAIDNNESELFFVQDTFRADPRLSFFVCDLRDRQELAMRMAGAEIVLHAAALKHVILCERSPHAAIQTNIIGTQNVLEAASQTNVERVLFTSSDKAVNPTNVMGTSKLMCERLVTAANAQTRSGKQVFASTRFGNVLGSRGSVIPIFRRQIALGGPVTLTDSSMTRFIMTLQEAVQLVTESVFLARGGEVFVTKMPVARIADLAAVMIEELAPQFDYTPEDIKINIIGSKAGEKYYEELMNDEEVRRSVELQRYYAVTPAFKSTQRDIDYVYPDMLSDGPPSSPYNSNTAIAMSKEELRTYMHQHGYLTKEV